MWSGGTLEGVKQMASFIKTLQEKGKAPFVLKSNGNAATNEKTRAGIYSPPHSPTTRRQQ